MVFIEHNSLKSDIFLIPYLFHVFQDSCFSGSRFFRVQIFQSPGFSGSRFFSVQDFQGPGFSGSGSRFQKQPTTATLFAENSHAQKNILLQTSQAFVSSVNSTSKGQRRVLFDNCSQKSRHERCKRTTKAYCRQKLIQKNSMSFN